jgi:hypothetical protein
MPWGAPLAQDPWVEVGTGADAFEPVEDGDVLAVERGSQGGQHVWAGVRAWGVDVGSESDYDAMLNQDRPLVGFELECPDGVLSFDNTWRRLLPPADDGTRLLVGRLVQFEHWVELPADWQELDWAEVEAELEDIDMTLRVTVEEAGGDLYVDERIVRLEFPTRD